MANTTNFNWETPDDTDLVKDGAAAIRTLGSAIDTSLVDLKGGTTNQVLAKNSDTDMDFKWVADAAGMTNPMTTTGDTIYSSSGSTPARLAIGSTGNVLTVAGGVPTWAAPAGGGKVLQVVSATGANGVSTSSSSNVDTGLTVSITPSSATSKILVMAWHSGYVRNNNSSITGVLGASNLLRGATSIAGTYFGVENYASSTNKINYTNWTFMELDEPNTTAATTYKTQYAIPTGTLNASNEGFIVAMEIGA